jgi:hypothetical protein
MGYTGIQLQSGVEVMNVRVQWNRSYGILAGDAATVAGNVAVENGFRGISTGSSSTISGNTTVDNGSDGLFGPTFRSLG